MFGMFGLLRKSNKEKKKPFVPKNQELIEKLQVLLFNYNVADIINKPHNKIFIMNVYYVSYEDLLFNLVNKADDRPIAAVNIYAYFKNYYTEDRINYSLKRIISILQNNDINIKVQHDLEELVNSIEFLISFEEKT